MSDVKHVLPEADVQGPRCHTNVLHLAPLAFNQIDHTLAPTGSRCVHLVGFSSDSTSKCVSDLDVFAGLTAISVARAVSCY